MCCAYIKINSMLFKIKWSVFQQYSDENKIINTGNRLRAYGKHEMSHRIGQCWPSLSHQRKLPASYYSLFFTRGIRPKGDLHNLFVSQSDKLRHIYIHPGYLGCFRYMNINKYIFICSIYTCMFLSLFESTCH